MVLQDAQPEIPYEGTYAAAPYAEHQAYPDSQQYATYPSQGQGQYPDYPPQQGYADYPPTGGYTSQGPQGLAPIDENGPASLAAAAGLHDGMMARVKVGFQRTLEDELGEWAVPFTQASAWQTPASQTLDFIRLS